MNPRNYIEIGILIIVFIALLIWKLRTRKKVSDMDGFKGVNNGAPDGKGQIVGKFGEGPAKKRS